MIYQNVLFLDHLLQSPTSLVKHTKGVGHKYLKSC